MLRGADIVAGTLHDLGVTRIFTLSGNHIMPVFDALLSTNIQLIHARHEAACVHMADAWGRLTGEPGIALVTGGQGHSNAVAALYTALASESPLLLLSGHASLSEFGRGAFQEMAQAYLASPVTKRAWTAHAVTTLGSDIAKALELATSGRPGPVHVSLPVDLLEQAIADEQITTNPKKPKARISQLSPEVTDQAISHLRAAAKPLVICGPAMCTGRGRKVMREAADALDVPVVGMESPRGINDPGLGAFAELLIEADLVVLIGKRLDFTLRFGEALSPSCKWIMVDPDAALIARAATAMRERVLLSAVADAQTAIEMLTERSRARAKPSPWREHVSDMLGYEPPQWKSACAKSSDRVHPIEMCSAVSNFIEKHPGATFVSDGGEIGQWAQALVKTDRRIINGVAGTIGVSLPFAIAAQLARPDHPVVAVMGDGTFGFHMAEFDTAVRYDLPLIVVVGNDARWNAEYQIQLRQYGAERAKNCDLLPSRYDRVAEALGGFGALVSTAAGLSDALDRAYLSRKPACINVMIESVAAPIIRR